MAAAGDIAAADDLETGAARSAALITDRDPAAVIAVGDLAYDSGTVEDFDRYYDPTWGAFKGRTLSVPGNHEYGRSEGSGYLDYFGDDAGESRGVDLCGWRILLVNQYEGVEDGAQFIAEDAAAHPRAPLIVVLHEPRFSSGDKHGSDSDMQPLWSAAVRAGADIVLNAHDHDYERFEPLDETGESGPRRHDTIRHWARRPPPARLRRRHRRRVGSALHRHPGRLVPHLAFRRVLMGGAVSQRGDR